MREPYIKLIDDVREYYTSNLPELKNIKGDKGLFDLKWCPDLKDEINIWNYWQGRGQKKANIMVVGQDFGNYEGSKAYEDYKKWMRTPETQAKAASQEYIERIKGFNSPTDKGLIKLTTDCLGKTYSASIPGNENLFFTNLCLGYRLSNTISGGNVFTFLKHDSIYLKRLIEIKQPEVVICLGADTYLASLTGLVDLSNYDKYRDYFGQIDSDFWSLLDKGDNSRDISIAGHSITVFGVAHTGSNGRINRKRLSKKHRNSKKSAFDLMQEDWKRIKGFIKYDYR